MKLTIYHHKTYIDEATAEETTKCVKACRIWYRDFRDDLKLESLFNGKEKSFPTGYLEIVLKKLKKRNVEPILEDKRKYPSPHLFFKKMAPVKTPWEHQKRAMDAITKNPIGIVSSIMGSGKSYLISETFLQKRVKTLIIVPTTVIQKQLYKDFAELIGSKNVSIKTPKDPTPYNKLGSSYNEDNEFSPAPKKILGDSYLDRDENHTPSEKKRLGSSYLDGNKPVAAPKRLGSSYTEGMAIQRNPEKEYLDRKKDPNKFEKWKNKQLEKKYNVKPRNPKPFKIKEYAVTILCFSSLENLPPSFLNSVECVMIDEAHHSSSVSIREALLKMPKAAYRYFFSATPWRDNYKDQMLLASAIGTHLIFDFGGAEAIEKKIIAKPKYEVISAPTPDRFLQDIRHWRTILEEGIIGNAERNKAIIRRAIDLMENGRNVFICVDEVAHLEILQERFQQKGVKPLVIHGQMGKLEKEENIELVSFSKAGMISIGTMAVGEGANLVNVDAVILAGGGKGSTRFLQRIGRGIRKTDEKDEMLVLDFLDWFNPTLAKHSRIRKKLFVEMFEKPSK